MPIDTAHYVLSIHTHNLAPYVGKGRQQAAHIIEFSMLSDHWYALTSNAAARAGYVLYRALVFNWHKCYMTIGSFGSYTT